MNRSDNFNRANGAITTPSDGGSNWAITASVQFEVVSNTAKFVYAPVNPNQAVLDAATSEVEVSVVSTTFVSDAYGGVVFRWSDIDNYMFFDFTNSGYRLYKRVAGSYTALSTGSATVSNGDTYKVTCSGNLIKGFINTTELASVSDSFNSTATKHGIQVAGAFDQYWDDFSILDTGSDTTPPVVATASIDTQGTTLTITFTEAGSPPVLPASGATGFTITPSGGAATLSSPAISNLTYTATTSRTILQGETITLDYAPGNVTDSAATPNALASFSGTSVTNNSTQSALAAGTATFVSAGPTAVTVTATAPTGGTGSLSYQWEYRSSTDDGATWSAYSDVTGATALDLADATVSADGTLYQYRCKQTKGVGVVTTNAVPASGAIAYEGGPMTGGGTVFFVG